MCTSIKHLEKNMATKFPYTPEYEAYRKLDKLLEFVKLIGFIAIIYSAVMLVGMFLSWIFIADSVNWTRVLWSFGGGFATFVCTIVMVMHLTPKVAALKQPYIEGMSMYMERNS
jgi:uncharacterized membrane protein YkgB